MLKNNVAPADIKPPTKPSSFKPLVSVLEKHQLVDKGGYITQEFQDYGYRLAANLNDLSHKSLYMKLAKTVDRAILDKALSFVLDATTARNKARLFMWKVKQLT